MAVYGIGQAIVFLPCGFFFYLLSFVFLSSSFPRLILAVGDWMSSILNARCHVACYAKT